MCTQKQTGLLTFTISSTPSLFVRMLEFIWKLSEKEKKKKGSSPPQDDNYTTRDATGWL